MVESVAAGLAFAALLCWGSTCLVGSFRPYALAAPYWAHIPLRTDTTGALAFFMAAVSITASEYLRLRRRAAGPQQAEPAPEAGGEADPGVSRPMALAASKAVAILSTGLVIYLSFNAVTHPMTLDLQVTHLFPWPTEGTLRIVALVLVAISVGVRRYLQAS